MRTRGLTLVDVVVLLYVASMVVAYGALSRRVFGRRDTSERCKNNLKALAIAAVQYSDDHRFFPHSGPINGLAGGVDSDESARAVRLLYAFDYIEGRPFICPGSADVPDGAPPTWPETTPTA